MVSGDKLVEMNDTPYDTEDTLQALLENFPEILSGNQSGPGDTLRWQLVKREAAIPDGGGPAGRWSVDHLFVDQNAVPSFVEVKRSSDTRIRREVVGQMLEYAANAVKYWPKDSLRQTFESSCKGGDPAGLISSLIGSAEPADIIRFWEQAETNLRAGKVRMIFVADEIPDELRCIIEFLSGQLSTAELMAVEVRQYVNGSHQALVPTLIASPRRAPVVSTAAPRQWDRPSFLEALRAKKGDAAAVTALRIMDWAESRAELVTWWGKGAVVGSYFIGLKSYRPPLYPVAVWTSGDIQMQYQPIRKRVSPEAALAVAQIFSETSGIQAAPDIVNRYPCFPISRLDTPDRLNQFFEVLTQTFDRLSQK
jgi:hypothetical protein